MSSSANEPRLDSCGCCEAEAHQPDLLNRPGLPELAYRIGTHPDFLRRMLASLPRQTIPEGTNQGARPLGSLTTRSADDPAIALLDAWATVADVLAFYQERIANEGYLRTATERRSVLELARTIGYELGRGVAASAFLAFTVEGVPGAPGKATVPEGTKIQSIPEREQLPQTFETVEEILARAEWNALRPRKTELVEPQSGDEELYLEGVTTGLSPGDGLLIVGAGREADQESERWDFRRVKTVTMETVTADPATGYTKVTLGGGLAWKSLGGKIEPEEKGLRAYALRQRASLFGYNAPDWRAMPDSVRRNYLSSEDDSEESIEDDSEEPTNDNEWPSLTISDIDEFCDTIQLDAAYPRILTGSWLVLSSPDDQEVYQVKEAVESSRTGFTLASKTTRIKLQGENLQRKFDDQVRETTVFAQSERLELAEKPLVEPVQGNKITLDRLVPDIERGRPLVVSGKRARIMIAETAEGLSLKSPDGPQSAALRPGDLLRVMEPPVLVSKDNPRGTPLEELVRTLSEPSDSSQSIRWRLMDRDGFVGLLEAATDEVVLKPAAEDDPTISEIAFIGEAEGSVVSNRDRTTVALRRLLQSSYDRATVSINANVARATHGETVRDEVLGSGDGMRANQRFELKKPPLTHVSAPTTTGAKSTLAVRVDGVLWDEAPSLYGLDTRSQSYVVRTDGDGKTRIVFGDGEMGSRLPSGMENVLGTYRSGIGLAGMVAANRLTLLQTRPLGIREVTNPLPATGAAEPEALEEARANAPSTVVTLDRIVSLRDFEDFARAFAGIGKTRAAGMWIGERHLVHITVAAANGDEVLTTSELYANLVTGIDAARDPGPRVKVASYERRTFSLSVGILVNPRHVPEDVEVRVRSELLEAFSFEKRDFGQPVTAAEVVKVIQSVKGVDAVDLDELALDPPETNPLSGQPPAFLPAKIADQEDKKTQLLLLNPGGLNLRRMTP